MSKFMKSTDLSEFQALDYALKVFNKDPSNIDKLKQISDKIIKFCLSAGSTVQLSDEQADIMDLSNIQIRTDNNSTLVNDVIVGLNQFIEANNKFNDCVGRYESQNRLINWHFEPRQLFNNTLVNDKGYRVRYTDTNGELCVLYFDSSEQQNHSSKYLADQAIKSEIIIELRAIRDEIVSTFSPIFKVLINLKFNDPYWILLQEMKYLVL